MHSSMQQPFSPAENIMVREAVGIFPAPENLQAAIDELQQNGFMQQEISILSEQEALKIDGTVSVSNIDALAQDPGAARAAFVPTEVRREAESILIGVPLYVCAAAGAIAAAATGADTTGIIISALLAGVGAAALGAVFAWQVSRRYGQVVEKQLKKGGLLLWVNLRSPLYEMRARRILSHHAAQKIIVHDIPLYN